MAEKTIGLRLQINGIPQTITNIKQLEETISQLEGELKGVEIGSAKFNQLSTEIRNARGKLEDFNKSTEGFGFEKLVESVGKFSAGVTSAFATAGAAAQIFGADTEEVNAAAAKAQNLLTIAIGATSIAEGILAAKKLFTRNATIAETAATVTATTAVEGQAVATATLATAETAAAGATGVLTTAINTLGNAIKKNPILFIVGTLLAAGAAIYTFTQEVDESADAVAKLDEETRKLIQSQDELANSSENALQKELALAEARNASIEEIAALRQKGIQNEIDNAKKRLTIVENAQKKETEIQKKELNKGTIDREEYNKRKLEIDKKYGDQSFQQKTAQAAAETKLEIDKINTLKEIRERDEALKDKARSLQTSLIKNDLARQLQQLKDTLDDELEAVENNEQTKLLLRQKYYADRKKLIEDAEKENLELLKKLNKEYEDLDKSSGEKILEQLKINNTEQLKIFLENTKKLNQVVTTGLEERKVEYIDSAGELKTLSIKLTEDQYKTILNLTKKYVKLENEAKNQLVLEGLKSQQEILKKGLNTYVEELTQSTAGATQGFLDRYIVLRQDALIKIEKEVYNKDFDNFKKTELDKLRIASEIEAQRANLSEQESKNYVFLKVKEYELFLEQVRITGEKEIELNTKKLVQQIQIDKLTKESTLSRLDAEKSYYDSIIKLQQESVLNDEELLKQKEINQGVYVSNALANDKITKKQLEENEKEYRRKVRDEELKSAQESLRIQKQLVLDKIKVLEKDPTMNAEALKTLYAELSKITVEYNNNVRQQTTNTVNDNEEKTQELIGNLQKGIDTFSQTISQIGSLLSQSYSLQLEKLQLDYENTLSQIVGDTEEANILREKEEIMYQNKKKAIEKKARLDSLKIQIAQAVADTASAVLKTYAEYGFSPVGIALGILAAGMGAVQVGIISQQIGVVNSMARGGFLRGPSHEQGGIKYQGGGVELEGNEAIINRRSTLQYAGLLSQINEQGGGKPIYVNSIMDSRMAEVLASTRNEPIRAYVLEQDITKSQAVNRRLEELASF